MRNHGSEGGHTGFVFVLQSAMCTYEEKREYTRIASASESTQRLANASPNLQEDCTIQTAPVSGFEGVAEAGKKAIEGYMDLNLETWVRKWGNEWQEVDMKIIGVVMGKKMDVKIWAAMKMILFQEIASAVRSRLQEEFED
jgi:hypothetical protein